MAATAPVGSHLSWRRAAATADLAPADLLVVQTTLVAGASPTDALQAADTPTLRPLSAALQSGAGLPALAATLVDDAPGHAATTPSLRVSRGRRHEADPFGDAWCLPSAAASLVRATAVAQVVGAPAGPAVGAVLDAVRADIRLRGLVRTRSAEAVMSARFLIGLPIAAAGAITLLDPGARAFVLGGVGAMTTGVAALLITTAAWWIRRLLTSVAGSASAADPLVSPPSHGPDATLVATVLASLVALVAGGPAAAVATALAMRVAGPILRRRAHRLEGTADPTGPPTASVTPTVPGGLPTVEAIELVALALSAGVGLTEACRLVGRLGPPETRPAFADVAGRLATGLAPGEAFPIQLTEIARLIDVTHRWGAPTAEALRLLAGDIRDRAAVAAEEAAERLAVRLVFPTTLLLVPAFGLLVVVPIVASTVGSAVLGG